MKNTNMKKKKYNSKNRSKILSNNVEYQFKDDDEIFEQEIIDEPEMIDDHDNIDLVAVAKEEIEEVVETPKVETKVVDKTKFYVDPKEFDEEIMNYYKSGKMSDTLAEMVSKISHKLSYANNFINYSYREEMVGDGVIRMMKALIAKKYNHTKGTNPFSYFTRIAFNAFRNRIKKEKHIHETHEKYQKELMFMSEQYSNLSKNNNIRIMKERNREY